MKRFLILCFLILGPLSLGACSSQGPQQNTQGIVPQTEAVPPEGSTSSSEPSPTPAPSPTAADSSQPQDGEKVPDCLTVTKDSPIYDDSGKQIETVKANSPVGQKDPTIADSGANKGRVKILWLDSQNNPGSNSAWIDPKVLQKATACG